MLGRASNARATSVARPIIGPETVPSPTGPSVLATTATAVEAEEVDVVVVASLPADTAVAPADRTIAGPMATPRVGALVLLLPVPRRLWNTMVAPTTGVPIATVGPPLTERLDTPGPDRLR